MIIMTLFEKKRSSHLDFQAVALDQQRLHLAFRQLDGRRYLTVGLNAGHHNQLTVGEILKSEENANGTPVVAAKHQKR